MSSKLSWHEIQSRYPDEWVTLTDYQIEGREPVSGVVVAHGRDKRSVYQESRCIEQRCAVIFTGEHERGLLGVYVEDMDDPSSE